MDTSTASLPLDSGLTPNTDSQLTTIQQRNPVDQSAAVTSFQIALGLPLSIHLVASYNARFLNYSTRLPFRWEAHLGS